MHDNSRAAKPAPETAPLSMSRLYARLAERAKTDHTSPLLASNAAHFRALSRVVAPCSRADVRYSHGVRFSATRPHVVLPLHVAALVRCDGKKS